MNAADESLYADIDATLMVTVPESGNIPDHYARWLAAGLGAVLVVSENVTGPGQAARFVAAIRRHSPEVLVAVDEEGGDVTRLERSTGSSYPGNLALGAVDDVNSDRRNPVIGSRSFGADPALVARHTEAFVAGLHASGTAGCAKHFPGHGATVTDSHLGAAVDNRGARALEADLLPFRAAIAAGVEAVMTAHVRFPALDSEPATLSRPILTPHLDKTAHT